MSETPRIDSRILEMMASHMCHDLVSPVGAVNNGVEFMRDMDGGDDALDLISSSALQAAAKLQCFRLAYGGAGSGSNVTFDDVRNAYQAYLAGGRVTLNWAAQPSGVLLPPAGFMKIILNLLMLLGGAIPVNGEVAVENGEQPNQIKLSATGTTVAFKEGVEAALNHTATIDDLTPRTVHAYMTLVFAKFYGVQFEMTEQSDTAMRFVVTHEI